MQTLRSLKAATSDATGEVWKVLITIAHPQLAALGIESPELGVSDGVMRFAASQKDVVSRGLVFKAFGFDWIEPEQSDQGFDAGSLRIDNVDRRIAQVLRSIKGRAEVKVEIVLASQPDVVDRTYPDFIAPEAGWDEASVEISLSVEDDSREPAVAWAFTPDFAPGLF